MKMNKLMMILSLTACVALQAADDDPTAKFLEAAKAMKAKFKPRDPAEVAKAIADGLVAALKMDVEALGTDVKTRLSTASGRIETLETKTQDYDTKIVNLVETGTLTLEMIKCLESPKLCEKRD